MLRLGLVGAGPWGRNLIRTIRATEGVFLSGVASRNADTAGLVGPESKIYPEWRTMLEREELDGLVVATPPGAQVEIAREAIVRGIPVLLEKPVALWQKDAEALRELSERKRTPVLVDHIHLFNPAYRALKARVQATGSRIASIKSAGGNQGPFRRDVNALWDYGPHDLAMAIDLMGEAPKILSVEAESCREREDGTWQGNFLVKGEFSGGTTLEFRSGNLFLQKTRVLDLGLTSGERLIFDDLAPVKVVSHGGGEVAFVPAMPLTECVRHFVRGIKGERDALWGLDLGVKVVGALEACEMHLE